MPAQDQKYKAVVIGCGNIGSHAPQSHARSYLNHNRIELVGLSDTQAANLARAKEHKKEQNNIRFDLNSLHLCNELRPDIVSICTPNETHFEIAKSILENAAPRVLFIEKPIATKTADAEALLNLARQKKCLIAINYSRRYSGAFQKIKSELESGKHGRPVNGRFLYGKGLLHNGGHALDLLRYWFGEPSEMQGKPRGNGLVGDANYDAHLVYPSGLNISLESIDEKIATVFECDVITEKSRWIFRRGGLYWEFFSVEPDPSNPGYKIFLPIDRSKIDPAFSEPMKDCLNNAVNNLVQTLDGKSSLLCSGSDGLSVLKTVDQIRASV